MNFLFTKDESSMNHRSYFTRCSFKYKGNPNSALFLVDTGAAKTVLPIDIFDVNSIKSIMQTEKTKPCLQGIVGESFGYHKIIVNNFELAEGLIIPSVAIAVCEEEINTPVLGFDILSLFSLRYDASLNNGLWYAISSGTVEETLDGIMKRRLNKDMDYIDPDYIAPLSFNTDEYLKMSPLYNILPKASIEACKTKEDCDELLKRLGG